MVGGGVYCGNAYRRNCPGNPSCISEQALAQEQYKGASSEDPHLFQPLNGQFLKELTSHDEDRAKSRVRSISEIY